ncbi:hypothetical protein V502_03923 [Pseudogymnoascus sp. VKM F-4520 (FW-2644)]|nr:hypothetical protein V502_03923 [Pseudogymnoascus sp. VKM F-4520 (FW-2644)]
MAIKQRLRTPKPNSRKPSQFDSFQINNHNHTLETNITNTDSFQINNHIHILETTTGTVRSQTKQNIMQRHHHTGSTESFQTAHNSPPSSPQADNPEPELITQSQPGPTSISEPDRRRSFRRSTLSTAPPSLIRSEESIISEDNTTDSGPGSPILSDPRPRTPSLYGLGISYTDMGYYQPNLLPYNYTPPRTYIPVELFMVMLIPVYMLLFLVLWFPEPATVLPISLTMLAITLWAAFEYFIGRPFSI